MITGDGAESNFSVHQFLIPSEKSQACLSRAVLEFTYSYGSCGSLILVYDAGHGDPALDGDRQAAWAA